MLDRRSSPRAAPCVPRAAWALLAGTAAIAPARAASADEPAPTRVEVQVRPGDKDWSVGGYTGNGAECRPTCTISVPVKVHHVTIGGASTDVLIDTPSEVVYHPALPALLYSGIALVVAGAGAGGVTTALALKGCGGTSPTSICKSRTAQNTFAAIAAVSFGTAVAGGFMIYFAGESIRISDLPKPQTSSRLTLDVSAQGAAIGWSLAF
jgi:hypothetical protein